MAIADSNGVRISWQETGAGSPILLVMGAGFSSAMWYPVIPDLAQHRRVIWFDNRGTGDSQATAVASIGDMAADAVAVLDAAGASAAHIYGVSLGGVIVLELARQAPQRVLSLVLGCTGILSADMPRAPKWSDVRFRLPRRVSVALSRKVMYGSACPPDRRDHDLDVLRRDRTQRIALVAQQVALRAYSIRREDVAALDVPALVLHGTEDTVVKPEVGRDLADALPHDRFIGYPGTGHNYLVACGAHANADVTSFLSGVDDGLVDAPTASP